MGIYLTNALESLKKAQPDHTSNPMIKSNSTTSFFISITSIRIKTLNIFESLIEIVHYGRKCICLYTYESRADP